MKRLSYSIYAFLGLAFAVNLHPIQAMDVIQVRQGHTVRVAAKGFEEKSVHLQDLQAPGSFNAWCLNEFDSTQNPEIELSISLDGQGQMVSCDQLKMLLPAGPYRITSLSIHDCRCNNTGMGSFIEELLLGGVRMIKFTNMGVNDVPFSYFQFDFRDPKSLYYSKAFPNTSLEVLDLSNNSIEYLPMFLLRAFPSLKEINLQGNPIKAFPLSLASSIKCGIPTGVEIDDDIAYAARLAGVLRQEQEHYQKQSHKPRRIEAYLSSFPNEERVLVLGGGHLFTNGHPDNYCIEQYPDTHFLVNPDQSVLPDFHGRLEELLPHLKGSDFHIVINERVPLDVYAEGFLQLLLKTLRPGGYFVIHDITEAAKLRDGSIDFNENREKYGLQCPEDIKRAFVQPLEDDQYLFCFQRNPDPTVLEWVKK